MPLLSSPAASIKPDPDTSVKWHCFYNDPLHDIVLVSEDKIHFRASSFQLARESAMLEDPSELADAIMFFAGYHSRSIETFLDLSVGRPIGKKTSIFTIPLIQLLVESDSDVLRERLFDGQTELSATDLAEGLRLAGWIDDISWAGQCLRRLAVVLDLENRQDAYRLRMVLDNVRDDWKLVFFDILLGEAYGTKRVTLRQDWGRIATSFGRRVRESQDALEPVEEGPVAATGQQLKRSAGSGDRAVGERPDKLCRT